MNLESRINKENIHLESDEDGSLYSVADQDGVVYEEMVYIGDEDRLKEIIDRENAERIIYG